MLKRLKSSGRAAVSVWDILAESAIAFDRDNALKFSASLAYYTIFSLPPMLIVIIATAGIFYGQEAIQGKIFGQINELVGNSAAYQIEETIKNISLYGDNIWATAFGFITLTIGATGIFAEIQSSINTIWRLKTKPKKGFIKLLITRFVSFSMVISLGFLLMVSLIINALLVLLSNKLMLYLPNVTVYLFYVINFLLTFGVMAALFAIIFKVLPDAHIKWKDIYPGALVTTALFLIGKFLIGYYLGRSDLTSTYGAAGSIIILLIWVYYSSIILFFGAEFTQVYAYKYGSKITPNSYAVWIEHKDIEKLVQPDKSEEIK